MRNLIRFEPNGKSFTDKTEFQSHNDNFHGIEKLYETQAPNKTEESKRTFIPFNSAKERLSFYDTEICKMKCNHCDESFENRILWEAHIQSEHRMNPYVCSICPNVSFPTRGFLKKHLLQEHPEHYEMTVVKAEWPCDFPDCTYVGKTRRNLWAHKRNHRTEKPFKCDQCDYTSKQSANLKIHKELVLK